MKELKAAVELDTKLAYNKRTRSKAKRVKKALLLKEIDRMTKRDKLRTKKVKIPAHEMDLNTKKDIIIEFLIKWRQKEFKAGWNFDEAE